MSDNPTPIIEPNTEINTRNQVETLHTLKMNMIRSLRVFDPASDDFGTMLSGLDQVMVRENELRHSMNESILPEPAQITELRQKREQSLATQNTNP